MHGKCVLQTVHSVLKDYELDLATYVKVSDALNVEMAKGLSKTDNMSATVKMLITYVRSLPTGKGASFLFQCSALSLA